MANPKFVGQFTLNYLGDKEWEVYDQAMMDDMPSFQGDDETSLVAEVVVELANEHFDLSPLPVGGMCICLVAGELVYRTYDGPEGREYDMDIEIDWSHFRVLNENDIEILTGPTAENETTQFNN